MSSVLPRWVTIGLIPLINLVAAFIVSGFVVLAIWSGMPLATVGNHLLAGFATLVLGLGLFARGWIGGGDAKLFSATALWIGLDWLLEYAIIASLAGGALTIIILFFRRIPINGPLLRVDWLARLHHSETGIPYGIALAAAGLMVYTKSYWFTGSLG